MNILIFLLSFALVLSSMLLILLVLVQLPKKEAGLGQAFGSSTTDALFGPGSGNMLTKMTKYTAAVFFILTLVIWICQGHNARANRANDPRSALTAAEKAALEKPKAPPTNAAVSTNMSLTLSNAAPLTNSAAPALTNKELTPATPPPAPTK